MAGLYIHVPFCRQACHYCNFHFSVSQKNRQAFVDAVLGEMHLQKSFLPPGQTGKAILETVYFGGGTPSLLLDEELSRIMDGVSEYFLVLSDAEITLEANPDDLTTNKLHFLKRLGINRLSIGIQSFHQHNLTFMNRSHTSGQALEVLDNVRDTGFENITIDLIYGTPGLTDDEWIQNIETVAERGIPHISAYSLTVENNTALDVFIRRGKLPPVDEEQAARQFDILFELAEKYGYEHYETSNFGKKGFFSRHNLGYWSGKPYLGLGPSAHSFSPGSRQWNVSNTSRYITGISKGKIPFEREELTPAQEFNEYIMTSLRTIWGMDKGVVKKRFGREKLEIALRSAQNHIARGKLKETETHLIVTKEGKFFADGIASDLFIDH